MKFYMHTLGCKVNIYESEYVISLLIKKGYEITEKIVEADICIINTCTVTNNADRKDRQIINHIKSINSKAIIVVMGCYVQAGNDVDADIIIGNKDKSKIVDLLDIYYKDHQKIKKVYNLSNCQFETMEIDNFAEHTRAFVKIQDGCNAYCSYCIIPYVRGNVRSKPFNEVINEIKNLVKNGYKEIVLTGIHTGRYGIDIGTNLEALLKEIVSITNIYRLRLSSIEINEVTDGIINLIANNDIMAKHLHIPLQSGSNVILKAMNRKYDKDYFVQRIKKIRQAIPEVSLTTDLIVGFPGETDEIFHETLETLTKIKFTKIHTFPYSKRKGTPAAYMLNQISSEEKKKRVKLVIDLSSEFEKNFYISNIGKTYSIVTEKRKNIIIGYTTNYLPVIVKSSLPTNKVVKVEISGLMEGELFGRVLS